jgi:aminoglycoside 6'-N-acetyltransferase I
MTLHIEHATVRYRDGWLKLRAALWPDENAEDMAHEIDATFRLEPATTLALLALIDGRAVGFAEVSVRTDYVNGCETSAVVFLEGIYVEPDYRRRGIARALIERVQAWGRTLRLTEFASDALLDNAASHAMHKALGFEETERVVYFRKSL